MKKLKVGVAMSGGVDSTASAIMLREDYNVTGFFMQLAQPDMAKETERVQRVADKLGIPLHIVDLKETFRQTVLNYFSSTYFQGLTPNPCMLCNREIKFGIFLNHMLSCDMDMVATGHYARVIDRSGTYHLHTGKDPRKEQSYFLARLSQQQLSRIIFPLGNMIKEDTFTFVEKQGFPSFRGTESQDVCFLADTPVATFLANCQDQKVQPPPGDIIDTEGKVLGHHTGIFNYTIGQRRGLGISAETPLYVVRLDALHNTVIVGSNDDLMQKKLSLTNMHWIGNAPQELPQNYTVKIRYSHRGAPATLIHHAPDTYELVFQEAQRAVTPGQFAVLYDGDELVGSGIIL